MSGPDANGELEDSPAREVDFEEPPLSDLIVTGCDCSAQYAGQRLRDIALSYNVDHSTISRQKTRQATEV